MTPECKMRTHMIPTGERMDTGESVWQGTARVWSHVQQFPPRKTRSGWWLVLFGVVAVALAKTFI